MNSPSVSILLPAYNSQLYIEQAVQSMLAQTYRDFEFIIIDDGSTDGTTDILRKLGQLDNRIRLIVRPNKGLTPTLIEGVGLSRAPLIARMDADDVSLPDRLEKQVAYMGAHRECVAVGGQVVAIDPDGDPIKSWNRPVNHEEIDAHHMAGNGAGIFHPAALIRREALERAGGYRADFEPAEDFDLWLRLAEIGRLANLPETVLYYRLHLQSISRTRTAQQFERLHAAIAEARRRRTLPAVPVNGTPPEPMSDIEQRRWWIREAWTAHHYRTVRKHAWKAFRQQPMSIQSWKHLAGGLLSLGYKSA